MLLLWGKNALYLLSLLIRPPESYPKWVGWVLGPCKGYLLSCSELGWKQNSYVLSWSLAFLGLAQVALKTSASALQTQTVTCVPRPRAEDTLPSGKSSEVAPVIC